MSPLQGHWERVNTPLRETTGRERRIVAIAVALLAAAAIVGVIVAVGSSSPGTPAGCIRIEVPSTMGSSASNICGDKAISSFCHGAPANSAPLDATALPKCRAAGY
jgi:hypothetical protein